MRRLNQDVAALQRRVDDAGAASAEFARQALQTRARHELETVSRSAPTSPFPRLTPHVGSIVAAGLAALSVTLSLPLCWLSVPAAFAAWVLGRQRRDDS
ncbi:MAG: hypothetical protein AB1938_29230 [Myxococcota bacterium]